MAGGVGLLIACLNLRRLVACAVGLSGGLDVGRPLALPSILLRRLPLGADVGGLSVRGFRSFRSRLRLP